MLDVSLDRFRHRLCSGVSRRDALRVGTLGPLGLTLGGLLRAESASAAEASARPAKAKSCILVYLGGGLSHHDSFDMKPAASDEIRGKYTPIDSNVVGTQVGELLPMVATCMDQVALVRSQKHGNDHHETATNWVLSGRFGSAFGDWPAIGAVVAHQKGFTSQLPPYVAAPKNPSFTWELGKSAFLGGRYESFKAGDPNAENYRVRDLTPEAALQQGSTDRRRSLLESLDTLQRRIDGNDQLRTFDEFQQRAASMILSPETQAAFDIAREKDALRERYGRTTFGQSCLLARRLVERGTRFVTVTFDGWDHHAQIWKGLENKLPDFDRGLSALLTDLRDRGLTDDTLVAVFGEFGRTPTINQNTGRDHWGRAGSMLFAGAGVRGGTVIGQTDETGSDVVDRPVSPADVAYTIYDALGIDPRAELHTPDGRPVEILPDGARIDELYA